MESEDIISAGDAVDGTDSCISHDNDSAVKDNNKSIIEVDAAVEGENFCRVGMLFINAQLT